MNICFVGAGYVGLTSAVVFAELGNKVWLVDIDKEKIDLINNGKAPFYEPGLGELIKKHANSGNLTATTKLEQGVQNSKIIFIAVGTPIGKTGKADLSQVEAVVEEIGQCLNKEYKLVVIKSTVPPGTTKKMGEKLRKLNPKINFDVAFCPEFLRPGKAIEDSLNPDRVVIGTNNDQVFAILKDLYQPMKTKIIRTSIESAEIIKYAANSYLALRIGFIDQIALLAEEAKADILEIVEGIGSDKRIGSHYWYPGIGYGGYCFPKDVLALSSVFKNHGLADNLFAKLADLNRKRPELYVNKLEESLGGLKGKSIGVLGLTAKPGTDDMRGSQAVYFIQLLTAEGAEVRAYDPLGMEKAKKILENVEFCQTPEKVAENASALCLLCEWEEFESLDWEKVKEMMDGDLVFDGKRMFDPNAIERAGLRYFGVGV